MLKEEPSTLHNLLVGVKTIWELCLFQVGPFVSLKRLQMEDSFFGQEDWSRKSCYGNSTKGVILFLLWWAIVVPSFKNTSNDNDNNINNINNSLVIILIIIIIFLLKLNEVYQKFHNKLVTRIKRLKQHLSNYCYHY